VVGWGGWWWGGVEWVGVCGWVGGWGEDVQRHASNVVTATDTKVVVRVQHGVVPRPKPHENLAHDCECAFEERHCSHPRRISPRHLFTNKKTIKKWQ
jgi:hypothetical protein